MYFSCVKKKQKKKVMRTHAEARQGHLGVHLARRVDHGKVGRAERDALADHAFGDGARVARADGGLQPCRCRRVGDVLAEDGEVRAREVRDGLLVVADLVALGKDEQAVDLEHQQLLRRLRRPRIALLQICVRQNNGLGFFGEFRFEVRVFLLESPCTSGGQRKSRFHSRCEHLKAIGRPKSTVL